MASYRIVTIDKAGKLSRHRGFVCDNNDDAIVWAKQSVDDAAVGVALASSLASNRDRVQSLNCSDQWNAAIAIPFSGSLKFESEPSCSSR